MIIHLINYKDPNRGGAQKVLKVIHEVTGGALICLADAHIKFKPLALLEVSLKVLWQSLSAKRNASRAEVIAHSRMYLPLLSLLQKCGVRTTYYCHAMYRSNPKLMSWMRADRYFAVSEAVKQYLIDLGIDSKRINVISNPLIQDLPEPDSTLEQKGLVFSHPDKEGQLIVFKCFSIGALEEWKGFNEAIQELSKIADNLKIRIEYTLIGSGSQRQDLELLALSLKSDRFEVFFMANVARPFEQVEDHATQLIPSLEEGFGLVAIEGMAAGKLILYKKIPALIEVCQHDPLCLEYDRFECLETHIQRLIFGDRITLEKNFFINRKKGIELLYGCDKFKKDTKTNFVTHLH